MTKDNGVIRVMSETYNDKETTIAGINGIRDCASTTLIDDVSGHKRCRLKIDDQIIRAVG
ncbi:hypothetical protein [Arthrobacter sp. H14]|uniref:hypothetical protein n=1 Tax=Arthrobacter sp. H14 TaxID=1312959 RepID=UPI0012DE5359|nr:hypothetical protein [Arthrobacter sp. H14]